MFWQVVRHRQVVYMFVFRVVEIVVVGLPAHCLGIVCLPRLQSTSLAGGCLVGLDSLSIGWYAGYI